MKGIWAKIQKWWWAVAIAWGILCGIIGYSFQAGQEYQQVQQKLEQNDKEHSEMKGAIKENYAIIDNKLDAMNTKLGRVEGGIDALLRQRRAEYQGITADRNLWATNKQGQ